MDISQSGYLLTSWWVFGHFQFRAIIYKASISSAFSLFGRTMLSFSLGTMVNVFLYSLYTCKVMYFTRLYVLQRNCQSYYLNWCHFKTPVLNYNSNVTCWISPMGWAFYQVLEVCNYSLCNYSLSSQPIYKMNPTIPVYRW